MVASALPVTELAWKALAAALVVAPLIATYANWRSRPEPEREDLFKGSYRTVNARLADCTLWLLRHLANARLLLAGLALLVGFATAIAPIAAVAAGDWEQLKAHGVPFAVGALLYGCLLECVTVRDRPPDTFNVNVSTLAQAFFAIGLVLVGWALLTELPEEQPTVANPDAGPSVWQVGFVGAALVALGDLVSLVLGLALAVLGYDPLRDPEGP